MTITATVVGSLDADGLPDRSIPFNDLEVPVPGGEGPVEIWLPSGGVCELAHIVVRGPLAALPHDSRPKWWHYGSSISQCSAAMDPLATWPALAATRLGLHLTNLGFGGQALLDPFVARTLRDSEADLISLEVGINVHNTASLTARTFTPVLHGFLDTIREGRPRTPILVVSPILFPEGEERPGPVGFTLDGSAVALGRVEDVEKGALSVGAIRVLVRRVLDARGDSRTFFLDGRLLFGASDVGLLTDGLHPGPDGYCLMGRRFADLVGPSATVSGEGPVWLST